jgi:phenylacetate-CoA ligase
MVNTTLIRETMPLLRYRTRDLSIINEEDCECGRSHPRIMRVGGRSDDMLIVGGVNVFPSQVEHVLSQFEGISTHYQIIIDRDLLDKLYVKAETAEGMEPTPELEKRAANELKTILGINSKLELIEFGTLERSDGKAIRIVDLRK